MTGESRRRTLPQNPYAEIPFVEWLVKLQSPGLIEDRYRAWSAVTTLLSPDDAWPHMMTVLSDSTAAQWRRADVALMDRSGE